MITFAKVKRATSTFIKVLRFGLNDVLTAEPVLPYGIDSKPVSGVLAVHVETRDKESPAVIGYRLHSERTEEGETRVYCTDEDGVEQFDIYLKKDGTCEFGGSGDFFVRYNELNSGLQTFVTDLNQKLVTALTGVGGAWPGTTLDINDAKIDNIETQ